MTQAHHEHPYLASAIPGLRLLPWEDGSGKPCYLRSSGPGGVLWDLADRVESDQLHDGAQVLAGAREVLADAKAGEYALRGALRATTHSLRAVLRVAHSRGARLLPAPDEPDLA